MRIRVRMHIIALLLSLTVGGCVISDEARLTIFNNSSFVVTQIFVTDVNNPSWGPDLLGGTVLYPGNRLDVYVQCDVWDIRIVDELGRACEVYNYNLCFDDDLWVIDNAWLSGCGW